MPETTSRYTPNVNDPWWLQAQDAMRGYLANSLFTEGHFQGIIRSYPVTSAIESLANGDTQPPTSALYSAIGYVQPHNTLGGSGVGDFRNTMLCSLQLTYAMLQQGATSDYLSGLYARVWIDVDAFLQALLDNQADPNSHGPGRPPLWQFLQFPSYNVQGGGMPTISFAHVQEQRAIQAIITFTLTSHLILP